VLRDFAAVFVCYPVDIRVQSGRWSDYSTGTSVTAGPLQVSASEIRGRRTAQRQMSTTQVCWCCFLLCLIYYEELI